MQNVTIVCLAEERERTVDRLGQLGTVHVMPVQPPASEQLDDLLDLRDRLEKAALALEHEEAKADRQEDADLASPNVSPDHIAEKVLDLVRRREENSARLGKLRTMLEDLAPWGSFSSDLLEDLRARGLHVQLCAAGEEHFPELPEGCVRHDISRRGKMLYAAVICEVDPGIELPVVQLPEITDAGAIEREIEELRQDNTRITDSLRALAPHRHQLEERMAVVEDDLTYVKACDGMGDAERVVYLQGFVPEKNLETLGEYARKHGWGVRSEPADPDDPDVPVLLRLPKLLRIAKPIFDFVGILPGYNEIDVSVSVLVFLTIFFGMIVGDAGYGAIFLATGLYLRTRVKEQKHVLYVKLFILMSCVTIVWGGLSGNWFAIPHRYLPAAMEGIDWLTEGTTKNRHIQWLCFLIGAIHLSMARFWRAALYFGTRRALGQIGWGLFLWGNFFMAVELIVYRGSFPPVAWGLYVVGLVLILTCGVNWKDVGGVMNLPFEFINSFVDVLSYIRLFAVGLSSYFIADSFNNMGTMLLNVSMWMLPVTILVILFGHALNIALAFMGVLVHGVRLNTLEFSNHMELGWSGRPYTPLKRHTS